MLAPSAIIRSTALVRFAVSTVAVASIESPSSVVKAGIIAHSPLRSSARIIFRLLVLSTGGLMFRNQLACLSDSVEKTPIHVQRGDRRLQHLLLSPWIRC